MDFLKNQFLFLIQYDNSKKDLGPSMYQTHIHLLFHCFQFQFLKIYCSCVHYQILEQFFKILIYSVNCWPCITNCTLKDFLVINFIASFNFLQRILNQVLNFKFKWVNCNLKKHSLLIQIFYLEQLTLAWIFW